MGRITEVHSNKEGVVREVELILPNKRLTRRPINLLVPLELDDQQRELDNGTGIVPPSSTSANDVGPEVETPPEVASQTSAEQQDAREKEMTPRMKSYELCSEGSCITRDNPPESELIRLPPEITLHEHKVHWKVTNGTKMKTVETTCPAMPFCPQVDCWFCTANVFNPACQPRTAFISMAVLLYALIAFLYTLCYVPVVLGKPVRIFFCVARWIMRTAIRAAVKFVRQRPAQRTSTSPQARRASASRSTGFVPILLIVTCALQCTRACQDVDIFEHRMTTCTKSASHRQNCTVDVTEIVKLNTFNKEACFRITNKPPGQDVALWDESQLPPLQCTSNREAEALACDVHPICNCQPAEDTVNCVCVDHNVTEIFTDVRRRLPIRRSWIRFREYGQRATRCYSPRNRVQSVHGRTSSDHQGRFRYHREGSHRHDMHDQGLHYSWLLYHCTQGAVATILCYSEREYTMASITCDDATFTVPCHPTGAISTLRFSFTRAQIRQQCVTTCGTTKTTFELTGILYWTRTLRTTAERVIAGQSTVYEFVLPDLGHILDVFISCSATFTMGKGKESSGKSAAELKKPPPPPKPSSSTASDKSSTPRTTTMTEAPSKKVHDERQENMEKAYNKILKGGWSLIGLAFDEYDKIQKEVAGLRQETHANTISLFSEVAAIRSSGSLEVRRSPQADDHRSSHRDTSRSRRPEEPTVRSTVRRVPTPNRDDTRTLQQIRNDIRDTDDKLRRLKRQMEHTLRENEPDSTDRLHDMNEDKKKLIAQKERLESMERRLAHDTRHQESRHGRSPPGKRSRTDSRGHQ
ncbi:hypothetical protein COOONC_13855 [Cooperia oncophora]